MKNLLASFLLLPLLSASLHAQVLEDFESGNLNGWNSGSGGNIVVNSSAAYSGAFGAEFTNGGGTNWYFRTDLTAAPGDKLQAKFRATAADGRLYMGFAASASGCWSAVVAPNTGDLILMENPGFGYVNKSTVSYSVAVDTWLTLEVDWGQDGTTVVNVYDESGATLIATTPPVQGPTAPGGIALRGFNSGVYYLDDYGKNGVNSAVICRGDGSGSICPCGNPGGEGEGCANSLGSGGSLYALGAAVVSAPGLQLHGSGLPPGQPGLYFQGLNAVHGGLGQLFGDGLRCAGGSVKRLQIVATDGAGESATTVDIAAAGVVVPGRYVYQLWYRDPINSPCGSSFNLTNGLAVTWLP